jgi:hypothetical protein
LLAFAVAGDTPSGRVRVVLDDAIGTAGAVVLRRPRLEDGQVIVINREPVLDIGGGPLNRLDLYGRPGQRYLLQHRPGLTTDGSWQTRQEILLNPAGRTNLDLVLPDGFFRLTEP